MGSEREVGGTDIGGSRGKRGDGEGVLTGWEVSAVDNEGGGGEYWGERG